MKKNFQFRVTIERDGSFIQDQSDTIYELDNFISMRPWLASSYEYQIIKSQLGEILRTQKVNLHFEVDDFSINGKLLIIIKGLKMEQIKIPKQDLVVIIFDQSSVENVDYSQNEIKNFNYHKKQKALKLYSFDIKNYTFSSYNSLKKLFIISRRLTNIKVVDQPTQTFIDLSKFINLKSITIDDLYNDILLPENLNYLAIENNILSKRILNTKISSKQLLLCDFEQQNIDIYVQHYFSCSDNKLQNIVLDQYFDLQSSQINRLTIKKNLKEVDLYCCEINTLVLPSQDIELLVLGSVNKIVVEGITNYQNEPTIQEQLDLTQLINLKSVELTESKIIDIRFPLQLHSIYICSYNPQYGYNKFISIDLSHLQYLQNLMIRCNNLVNIIMHDGKLLLHFDPNVEYHKICIKVNNIVDDKLEFRQYLESIQMLILYGIDHITIQDQPDDTIDYKIFKSLIFLESKNSPNIKVLNQINLNSTNQKLQ